MSYPPLSGGILVIRPQQYPQINIIHITKNKTWTFVARKLPTLEYFIQTARLASTLRVAYHVKARPLPARAAAHIGQQCRTSQGLVISLHLLSLLAEPSTECLHDRILRLAPRILICVNLQQIMANHLLNTTGRRRSRFHPLLQIPPRVGQQ